MVEEEMRRVLRTLQYEMHKWSQRAEQVLSQPLREDEAAGRRAYSMSQADALSRLKSSFEFLWLRSEPSRGKERGAMDDAALEATTTLFDTDLSQAATISEAGDVPTFST